MSPSDNNESDADDDSEEGEELAACKYSDQRRVRFAKIFHNDSEDRINDQEQSGDEAVRRAEPGPDKPKNRKENYSFERGFV